MTSRSLTLVWRSLALLLVCLATAPARASADGPRVAVLSFEGRGAVDARLAFAEVARDEGVELVRLDTAADAGRRASVRGTAARGAARAAQLADADIVVQGRVMSRRGRTHLVLIARDRDGATIARERVDLQDRAAQGLARAARTIRRSGARTRLASRLSTAEQRASDSLDDERPPSLGGRDERRSARARREAREEPEHASSERPRLSAPYLSALAGASARYRGAAFDTLDGGRFYRAWYASIDLSVEARPFAQESGAERGLYARAAFSHSVGLRSRAPDGNVVDTAFWLLYVEAGAMIQAADVLEIGWGVALGVEAFDLGEQSQIVVPSASYGYLRPAMRARARLVDELLVLDGSVGYRWVFERGGGLLDAFGSRGDGHGLDASVSLGGHFDIGLAWAVGVDFVTVFHSFAGDASASPADSGTDSVVRFFAATGVAFD